MFQKVDVSFGKAGVVRMLGEPELEDLLTDGSTFLRPVMKKKRLSVESCLELAGAVPGELEHGRSYIDLVSAPRVCPCSLEDLPRREMRV